MTASLNCVILTQVLALLFCPDLQDDDRFPQDAKRRAKRILDDMIGQTIGNNNRSSPLCLTGILEVASPLYHSTK